MQNCDEIEIELGAYRDGALQPPERATVETHLAACAACQATLTAIESTHAALSSLPKMKSPATLKARINAQIANDVALKSVQRAANSDVPKIINLGHTRSIVAWVGGIAAAIMVGLMGYITFFAPHTPRSPEPSTQVGFETTPAAAPRDVTQRSDTLRTGDAEAAPKEGTDGASQSDPSNAAAAPVPPTPHAQFADRAKDMAADAPNKVLRDPYHSSSAKQPATQPPTKSAPSAVLSIDKKKAIDREQEVGAQANKFSAPIDRDALKQPDANTPKANDLNGGVARRGRPFEKQADKGKVAAGEAETLEKGHEPFAAASRPKFEGKRDNSAPKPTVKLEEQSPFGTAKEVAKERSFVAPSGKDAARDAAQANQPNPIESKAINPHSLFPPRALAVDEALTKNDDKPADLTAKDAKRAALEKSTEDSARALNDPAADKVARASADGLKSGAGGGAGANMGRANGIAGGGKSVANAEPTPKPGNVAPPNEVVSENPNPALQEMQKDARALRKAPEDSAGSFRLADGKIKQPIVLRTNNPAALMAKIDLLLKARLPVAILEGQRLDLSEGERETAMKEKTRIRAFYTVTVDGSRRDELLENLKALQVAQTAGMPAIEAAQANRLERMAQDEPATPAAPVKKSESTKSDQAIKDAPAVSAPATAIQDEKVTLLLEIIIEK